MYIYTNLNYQETVPNVWKNVKVTSGLINMCCVYTFLFLSSNSSLSFSNCDSL